MNMFYVSLNSSETCVCLTINNEVEYPCCPGQKYGDVTYSLRMRRRSAAPREVRSRNPPPDPPAPPSTDHDDEGSTSEAATLHTSSSSLHAAVTLSLAAAVTWYGHVI